MNDEIQRRLAYSAEAQQMSDREVLERSWVEMRVLNHHVCTDINGKVGILWRDRLRRVFAMKVVRRAAATLAGLLSLGFAGWQLL